jgi:hypothetical protein
LLTLCVLALTAGVAVPDESSADIVTSARVCFPSLTLWPPAPGGPAIFNLTPVNASAPGYGLLYARDLDPPPLASNVNFSPGSFDPNLAITPFQATSDVCFHNSPHSTIDLVVDHLLTLKADVVPSSGIHRLVDTRANSGAAVGPRGRLCFTAAAPPGHVALVNLTPVNATAPGSGVLISSDNVTAPTASNVNFAPGTVDPNIAAAVVGGDRRVCFVNHSGASVDLVADQLLAMPAAAGEVPADGPRRLADTRIGLGGTTLAPSERRCMTTVGDPGDMAVVNLTPVNADLPGNGVLVSSDASTPIASNVNFGPGTIDPNVGIARIGADGRVCFANSGHSTVDLVADQILTIDADAVSFGGTPTRVLDTRLWEGSPASACFDNSVCVTITSEPGAFWFLRSTDGGTTWHHVSAESRGLLGSSSIDAFVCDALYPVCMASGLNGAATPFNPDDGHIRVTLDMGLTWATLSGRDPAIGCASQRVCVITSILYLPYSEPPPIQSVVVTTDAGQTWTYMELPPDSERVAPTCDQQSCRVAVADVPAGFDGTVTTTDGWVTWTLH